MGVEITLQNRRESTTNGWRIGNEWFENQQRIGRESLRIGDEWVENR